MSQYPYQEGARIVLGPGVEASGPLGEVITWDGRPYDLRGVTRPDRLDLQPHELAVVWAHLHLAPNMLNVGIRRKIETYFEACGVPLSELQAVAEQARAMAGAFIAGSVQDSLPDPPGNGGESED